MQQPSTPRALPASILEGLIEGVRAALRAAE
jgi:hypothetical protein